MAAYAPPLRDMRFVYHELHDCGALAALPGLAEFTADLVDPVLEEAGKICAEVLQPLNRPGDEEGCRLENGVVSTPAGFPEAYRLFREGGWTALACDPDYGGQGAPAVLDTLISEMISAVPATISIPTTCCRESPYLDTRSPPALVATVPPMVAESRLAMSTP